MPKTVARMTPRWRDYAACILTAPRLYLNSPGQSSMNWVQDNPNLNDEDWDPMQLVVHFGSRRSPTGPVNNSNHSQSTAILSTVACDIFPTIQPGVGVTASFPLVQDMIRWRQSNITGVTNVVIWQFAKANEVILAGNDPALDTVKTDKNFEMTREAQERNFTEWPRSITFWRCRKAVKTNVHHRRNLVLTTQQWQLKNTFQLLKRLSKHPSPTFSRIVQLHSNCWKYHLRHQLCLLRTSLESKINYSTFTESNELTIISLKVIRIVHLTVLWPPEIGLTTWWFGQSKCKQRRLEGRWCLQPRAWWCHWGSGHSWVVECKQ